MTADARPKLSDTLTAVRDTAQQIRKYTKEDVADLLAKLREVNTEILKIAKDFASVSSEVKEVVLLHRGNVDEMIDNMALVSANLKATSKEIRRNPWRLLYKPDEKELHSQNIYEAARAFVNGAEQLDQAVAKMTGLAKAHPEGIPSDDPTLLKVRAHLEETFGKFSKAEQALWKELRP
jgi:methyl-accepting chemotaxis protein